MDTRLWFGVLAGLVGAAALQAGATASVKDNSRIAATYYFSDASRDIVCEAIAPGVKNATDPRLDGLVNCQDFARFGARRYPVSALLPMHGKASIGYDSNAFDFTTARRHSLPSGYVWRRGYFKCISAPTSMRCNSLIGSHGFLLGRRTARGW